MIDWEYLRAWKGQDRVRISAAVDPDVYHERSAGDMDGSDPGTTKCGRYLRTGIFRETAKELKMRPCKVCEASNA